MSGASERMRRVRQRDTAPELKVRRALHRLGLRFRLHRRDLPGSPDIVLPKLRTAIFVHGCFWHRHQNCPRTTTPKTRTRFWSDKFEDNMNRDKRNTVALERSGWRVAIIWECETRCELDLTARLKCELALT